MTEPNSSPPPSEPNDGPVKSTEVVLALEEKADFRHTDLEIAKDRSRAENFFLRTVVISVAVSLPLVFFAIGCLKDQQEGIVNVYERWLAILGPLLGAAFGAGALRRGGEKS